MNTQAYPFRDGKDALERTRFFYQSEDPELGAALRDELLELLKRSPNPEQISEQMFDSLTENIEHIASVSAERDVEREAWKATPVSVAALAVPGMLDEDTMRYYSWLGSGYTGAGEVVELGCWMGRATICLAETLSKNPHFAGRAIQVFDSFRWEPWMSPYVAAEPELQDSFRVGECFIDLYRHYCKAFEHMVQPHQQLLNTDRERANIPLLAWEGGPVELLFYDFGQEYEQIKSAWEIFSPWFIPGKTIFVIQPYGNLRAGMLRRFSRDYAHQLKPLHKPYSAAKGFIFTG
jgi:hypothetical protein